LEDLPVVSLAADAAHDCHPADLATGQPTTLAAVDTPALLIDLDQVEANIQAMQALATQHGLRLRPHVKTSKSAEIARLQCAAGAVGICCAKLSEAEVMVEGGLDDIVITSPVVAPVKQRRLAALATRARLAVAVDHPQTVLGLAAAAGAFGVRVGIYVELDVGQARTGVSDPDELAELAALVVRQPQLRLDGMQAYNGSVQFIVDTDARRAAVDAVATRIRAARAACAARGVLLPLVSGGGTGSADFDVLAGAIDELQAGSYVCMDGQYAGIDWPQGVPPFGLALTVLATVISTPTPTRAVLDSGWKTLSVDAGPPVALDVPGARFRFGGDEHGVLEFDDPALRPPLGSVVRLRPAHVDTTVNLHDSALALRGGRVSHRLRIGARGCVR
jgi:D-serine deaminase-like pyridoxal phosphate-dependent protein